ncbi:helix-turn-helix domain-containing protein [Undibacterium sp. Di27W]|uniref:helix-turn-helix domain-containing protein n=1 Tax=Undibacterium sp. Di27W TaxID=3413036 RepID=UPI003BF28522
MNFGDKLKQIRTEKNWTQPQMAEVLQIEQSYLSKLENDKCLPSAEMFQSILHKLSVSSAEFLADLDKSLLQNELKLIPDVAAYLSQSQKSRMKIIKTYLFASALICLLGLSTIYAAKREIFFSNYVYLYESLGVIQDGEPENIYEKFRTVNNMKLAAGIVTSEQLSAEIYEFESKRLRPEKFESDRDLGNQFERKLDKGHRKFELNNTRARLSAVDSNRYLEFFGAILLACGLLGFVIEWRLRKLHLA